MMYVLGLSRGLSYYLDVQRKASWDKDARQFDPVDLSRATAFIVGVGGIGSEAARLCHAFGMTVIGVDGRWERDPASYAERHAPDELDALLPSADFVIVTTPHTPQTEGMWNRGLFELMKSSGYFINIGRGMTTRIDDLAEAVEGGTIAGCGLDVYEIEPLPTKSYGRWRMRSLPRISQCRTPRTFRNGCMTYWWKTRSGCRGARDSSTWWIRPSVTSRAVPPDLLIRRRPTYR
ncbi:TPA: hypothetical protein DCE37_18925 [Candidatus Latescibacteria bacterium]|nr:hypothetical protein [Candidatus Latescibacterota bacterium]